MQKHYLSGIFFNANGAQTIQILGIGQSITNASKRHEPVSLACCKTMFMLYLRVFAVFFKQNLITCKKYVDACTSQYVPIIKYIIVYSAALNVV